MAKVKLYTGPGVFEVLANVCRSPHEALRQFVENAADAIEQAKTEEGQIRVLLKYYPGGNGHVEGTPQSIAIQDNGVGMTTEKMRQVLHRIGDSEKLNLALRGEQGIGLLAFALIAQELHLASTAQEGKPSSCLVLKRSWLKRAHAEILTNCPLHQHTDRGTVAYLEGILPEIALQLTKERIKDYLGQQFASDLRANLYTMSLSDGHSFEQVHSQRFRGIKVLSTSLSLGRLGPAFIELYVLPWEMPDATISLYGRAGARICLLTDLADFKRMPWLDQRLEGYVRCDRLKRSADKTAVVQDQVYGAFAAALHQLEPRIQQLTREVSAESQERRFNIIVGRLGRLIDRFQRYRDKGLLADLPFAAPTPGGTQGAFRLAPRPPQDAAASGKSGGGGQHVTRPAFIKLQSPPKDKCDYRSWYDPGQSMIYINREHAEFLLSQREDRRCMRYLFSVWAKENLLKEYGPQAEKVADELVGMLAEAEPLLW